MSSHIVAVKPKRVRDIEPELERLLSSSQDDRALLSGLEELRRTGPFGLLIHRWGPALYERNPVLFRPFLLSSFTTGGFDGKKWRTIAWKDVASQVEPWFIAVDAKDDVELFRLLYV